MKTVIMLYPLTFSHENQQGMVLTTALLYLAILTLLVVTALSVSALQTKTSGHYFQAAQTFENAELALIVAETAIQPGEQRGEGTINGQIRYRFVKLAPSNPCADNYLVNATSISTTSKVGLESVWQLPIMNTEECSSDINIARRVSWRQTDE